MIEINKRVSIAEREICYRFSTSSKPGGQHGDKASTRVTLLFNVSESGSLSEADRARVLRRLATRISSDGILRVMSQKYRTQSANRRAALERFVELMREALKRTRKRKPTKVPRSVTERRLRDKKHRSRIKEERSRSRDRM